MTTLDPFLDQLAPGDAWSPAWDDVLVRAGRVPAKRWSRRRVVALVLVVLALVLAPLAALAASNDWWFLRHAAKEETPSRAPVVVKKGGFDGERWELVAFPAPAGLCWSLTFTADPAAGAGSAAACGPIVGFPSRPSNARLPITFLTVSGKDDTPGWIAGPVVPSAVKVELRFAKRSITTATFPAPSSLGAVRFYAVQLPRAVRPGKARRPPSFSLRWLAGYDRNGRIVACLNPRTARDGVSPLGACR
jgi:hypothetical protein